MRIVLQRVARAAVRVDGAPVGRIGPGLLLLVGFADADRADALGWMADKVAGLRVFDDGRGRMNLSLRDVCGEALVVSQFTLYGDARKGRRPSFVRAAGPEAAAPLYEEFVALLRERVPGKVATGVFGAAMEVELVNDGPVTLVLER